MVARRRETGDWATELFDNIGRDHALGGDKDVPGGGIALGRD
jgi:hypothetical protein